MFKEFYNHIVFNHDKPYLQTLSGKTGDTKSRGLYVTVIQNNVVIDDLTGLKMDFVFSKPDGTRGINAGVIDNGKFRIDYTNQVFAVEGIVKGELVLKGATTEQITSRDFKMLVHQSIVDAELISKDERGILDQAFELAEDIIPRIELIDIDLLENVETQFQTVIDETTGKDVISAPEIIAARDGEPNLKARLDKENQEVTAQLAQIRYGSLTFSKDALYRECYKNYYNYDDEYNTQYGALQGVCSNGENIIAMFIPIEYEDNYRNPSNLAKLVEFNSHGEIIRESEILKLYHGGTLAFHNNEIYVTGRSEGFTSISNVVVVDYTTFTVDREIILDETVTSLFFENNVMVGVDIHGVYYFNQNGTTNETILFENKLKTTFHSLKPYKNDYYIATFNYPNEICILNSNFKIIKVIDTKEYNEKGGEIKDTTFDNDGNFYLTYNGRSYFRSDNYEYVECYPEIVVFDLEKGKLKDNKSSFSKFVYVNEDTDNNIQDGSKTYPYRTINQALFNKRNKIQLVKSSNQWLEAQQDLTLESHDKSNTIIISITKGGNISLKNLKIVDGLGSTKFYNSNLIFDNVVSTTNMYLYTSKLTSTNTLNIHTIGVCEVNQLFNGDTEFSSINKFYLEGKDYIDISNIKGNLSTGLFCVNIRFTTETGGIFVFNYTFPHWGFSNCHINALNRSNEVKFYLELYIDGVNLIPSITNIKVNGETDNLISIDRIKLIHIQ